MWWVLQRVSYCELYRNMSGSSPVVWEEIFPLIAAVKLRVTSTGVWVFSGSSGRLNIDTARGEFPSNFSCPRQHSVPYYACCPCYVSVLLQKRGQSWYRNMDVNLQQKMPYESCSLWSNFFLLCHSLTNHGQPPVPHASYATIFSVLWKTWSMWFWGCNHSIQLLGICFCRMRWTWRRTQILDKEGCAVHHPVLPDSMYGDVVSSTSLCWRLNSAITDLPHLHLLAWRTGH